jgi:D-sedoheptulose 7-phosphate isomerase
MTGVPVEPAAPPPTADLSAIFALGDRHPDLTGSLDPLARAAECLVACLANGGTVFLAGNGGSMADALHIAGELKKSFERSRPLPVTLRERLVEFGGDHELAEHLEAGLRVLVLGADAVLASAVGNDIGLAHAVFAQELVALGRPGDVLVVLSTSGRSRNVVNASIVARALDMAVAVITGSDPSDTLCALATVVVRTPATATAEVQGWHGFVYHALCRVLEDTFFPAGPTGQETVAG